MIPPGHIAQFLWIGDKLSRMEQLCLRSFVAQGYVTHLYRYTPIAGVPPGVIELDAADILPPERIFLVQSGFGTGSPAAFADLFRYHLLHRRGGWWFDLDFVALKPPTRETLPVIASTFENEWGTCANNCALFFPANHPAAAWLRDQTEAMLAQGLPGFGDTGPMLVQRMVKTLNFQKHVAPWWSFCPYPWRQISRVAAPDLRTVAKDQLRLLRFLFWQCTRSDFRAGYIRAQTRAIHLHNETWKASGLDKNAPVHPLSLYGRLLKKHGFDPTSPAHV